MLKGPTWGSFAICQAVSYWSVTMEAWVLLQFCCGICGIQNATGKGFLEVLWFLLVIVSSVFHMHSFVCHWPCIISVMDIVFLRVCVHAHRCMYTHTRTTLSVFLLNCHHICVIEIWMYDRWYWSNIRMIKWWRMRLVGDVEGMRKCKQCVSWEISRCATIWMLWHREILKWII
jgi:hypothetical protein